VKKVAQMLSPAIGREEVLKAAKAVKILRDWPAIVGEAMAARSHPDRYDRGTVWVAVQGSAWAQELRMQKDQILERLDSRGKGLFIDLRFGVRPLPEETISIPERQELPKSDSEGLSIREIAERRLKNWNDGGDSSK
jgi:predicted nucleic acid-binding Zn ribbon protein